MRDKRRDKRQRGGGLRGVEREVTMRERGLLVQHTWNLCEHILQGCKGGLVPQLDGTDVIPHERNDPTFPPLPSTDSHAVHVDPVWTHLAG